MTKQEKVLEAFGTVLPSLTEPELDRLMAFGEGMAFKAHQQSAAQFVALPPALRIPEGGPGSAACPAP